MNIWQVNEWCGSVVTWCLCSIFHDITVCVEGGDLFSITAACSNTVWNKQNLINRFETVSEENLIWWRSFNLFGRSLQCQRLGLTTTWMMIRHGFKSGLALHLFSHSGPTAEHLNHEQMQYLIYLCWRAGLVWVTGFVGGLYGISNTWAPPCAQTISFMEIIIETTIHTHTHTQIHTMQKWQNSYVRSFKNILMIYFD